MADSIPTLRRSAARLSDLWAGFSYADSIVARGGVWTMICWLPMAVFAALPTSLTDSWSAGSNPVHFWQDPTAALFLLLFPGSLLGGFVSGAVLSGGAAGFPDSLKRGLKAVAVLVSAILIFGALMMSSSDEKAPLAAGIFFIIGAAAAVAGMFGGFMRWVGDRALPTARPAPAVPADPAKAWLEAVASSLREAGLLDYASAMALHKQLRNSGQADPEGRPPFEDKYEDVFLKLKDAFPAKDRTDWLAANEYLRRAALTAARAGGGSATRARAALETAFPGRSGEFYDWVADCARKLP